MDNVIVGLAPQGTAQIILLLRRASFPLVAKNLSLDFFIVYHLAPDDRERATATLTRLLRRGTLQHNVALRISLDDIARAHEIVEGGEAAGNVVVAVR